MIVLISVRILFDVCGSCGACCLDVYYMIVLSAMIETSILIMDRGDRCCCAGVRDCFEVVVDFVLRGGLGW